LDTNSLDLLNWAKKKKMEEEVLISLPSDNPAVKIARANVNRAKQELVKAEEQLKITEILIQDEETTS
jgi:AAA+ superfamily predicted ATPase